MKQLASLRLAFCLLVATVLIGCAALGVNTPQTFNDKVLAATLSVDSVQKTAATLLKAGKISVSDAENVLKTADTAMEGIKVARAYNAVNPGAAGSKLDAAVAGLTLLTAYLATQGAK